ncbi:MAG: Rpp14/Pop5 family protein [Candidatus Woesearchaeota archaeon]|jgi:RNase P/RNase MRP subunit POP5
MKSIKLQKGKKRYIVFKLNESLDEKKAHELIYGQLRYCVGTFGLEKIGYKFLKERYNQENKTGILKIKLEGLENVRKSLELIREKIKIIGVSGIIKKTDRFILKNNK